MTNVIITRDHVIYDVHTEEGGSIEICHMFADFILFKQ